MFQRIISAVVTVALVGLPFSANMAIAATNSVAEGNSFGATLQSGVSPSYDTATGAVSVGGKEVFMLEGASADLSTQVGAGDSQAALSAAVGAQLSALVGAGSKSGTASGSAYQTLMQAQGSKRPDMSNDAVVTNSETTIKNAIAASGVSDCKTVTTVESTPTVQRTVTKQHHCSTHRAVSLACQEGAVVTATTPPTSLGTDDCHGGDFLNYSYTCAVTDSEIPNVRLQISDNANLGIVQTINNAANYTGSIEFENCKADIRTSTTCENGQCTGNYAVDISYMKNGAYVFSGTLSLNPTFGMLQYGESETTCTPYAANAACTKVSETCLSTKSDGSCLADDVVYECTETLELPGDGKTKTQVQCPGAISCMGTSCGAKPDEVNADFAKASSTIQMLSNASKEGMSCDENGNCQIFKGNSSNCKKAMFGVVDCCNQPTGVNYLDYIALSYASTDLMDRFDSTRAVLGQAKGIWNDVTQPISNAATSVWDSISTTASTAFNTVRDSLVSSNAAATTAESALTGAVSNAKSIDTLSFLGNMKETLTKNVAQWAAQTFPGANLVGPLGSDALYTATMDAAGNVVGNVSLNVAGNTIASVLSVVGTAYLIYSIAMLVIQLIFSCDEDETKLAVNRELKLCHEVGSYCAKKYMGVCVEKRDSYCCYTSMLARIMNEQVRGQLGLGFGPAKNPDCTGITTAQLSSVDMTTIDLTEWIQSLKLAGVNTNSATDAQIKYSSQNMLKGVNPVTGAQRADTVEKAKALLGTAENPGIVDRYRENMQKRAYESLEQGNKPPGP